MEKSKDKKKTSLEALVLVLVLASAFIGLYLVAEHIEEENEVGKTDTPLNVSLIITKEGGWTIEYLDLETFNNTVFKLLEECSKRYDFPVAYTFWHGYDSIFINSINGTSNGEDGRWWQYYVNNDYGDVGCDRKEIFEGDFVEWRFEEPGQ
ncbi:MAG: DUF4430 domain-containing protein [Thermoplasmata archaeon]|nr:MAG: DUF4430 domain-containing protein [Thermoplasmata archaeon]